MPGTVMYRLYASGLGAGVSNAASALVVKPGKITAISISVGGVGGAAAGTLVSELNLNITAGGIGGTTTVNNPNRTSGLASVITQFPTTGIAADSQQFVSNISVPITVGDVFNFGTGLSFGTAPTNVSASVCIYVLEN